MAKTITLNIDKTIYKLEFNRRTIAWMEDEGFIAEELPTKPTTMVMILFKGALRMHHANIKPGDAEDMYLSLSNKSGLIEKLMEMYGEAVNSLLDDPSGDEGNATWSEN